MKQLSLRKRNIIKGVAAAALVLLAALFTMLLRDLLAIPNPVNVLPKMEVWHTVRNQRERLGDHYTLRDAYTWQFVVGGPVRGGGMDLEVWREIQPADVEPETSLELTFSFGPRAARVYMLHGGQSIEQTPEGGAYTYKAPSQAATYTYRVEANFGDSKEVTYYFRIRIPEW